MRPAFPRRFVRRRAVMGGTRDAPNNGIQRTALRAAADAERYARGVLDPSERGVP